MARPRAAAGFVVMFQERDRGGGVGGSGEGLLYDRMMRLFTEANCHATFHLSRRAKSSDV